MNQLTALFDHLHTTLHYFAWGPATIFLLAVAGIWFTVLTGFFQVRHLKLWWNATIATAWSGRKQGEGKGISGFQSACTALAATLGTGNIAGVATALAAGGPGAVFWMWISAFFGAMTGYAENVLAGLYRGRDKQGQPIGGAMFYIQQGLNCRWLAVLFSVLCILGSLGMGDMAQANSIATGLEDAFQIPPLFTGVAVALLVGFAIQGGIQRISRMTEAIVPFMAVLYTLAALWVVAVNWRTIPDVLRLIWTQAFSWQAGAGGVAGYGVQQALRIGVARGVSSNEAGLGSSVMANSASGRHPVEQGMWGIFEVVVDTLFMCLLTALASLCSGVYDTPRYALAQRQGLIHTLPNGAALTADAFRTVFGPMGGGLIALSLLLFAFSTLLGWSYYGERAVEYVFGSKGVPVYKALYLICIVIGCVTQLEVIWDWSDIFNGLMALPNLVAVLWLSPKVIRTTREYFSK